MVLESQLNISVMISVEKPISNALEKLIFLLSYLDSYKVAICQWINEYAKNKGLQHKLMVCSSLGEKLITCIWIFIVTLEYNSWTLLESLCSPKLDTITPNHSRKLPFLHQYTVVKLTDTAFWSDLLCEVHF